MVQHPIIGSNVACTVFWFHIHNQGGKKDKMFTIDRRLIRKMLNIKWQDKVSNDHPYKIKKLTSWSKGVKRQRLNLYGHLLRLPEKAPAKQALREAKKICRSPRGGQKITWMKLIEKDLERLTW